MFLVYWTAGLWFWYTGQLDYVFGILDSWTMFLVYWTAGLWFWYIGQLDYVFGILDSWTMFLVYWTAGLCFLYIGQLDYVFCILDSCRHTSMWKITAQIQVSRIRVIFCVHFILTLKAHWSLYVPPMVTLCTASRHYMYRQSSLYVPPVVTICTTSLIFNNSTFCPNSVLLYFVWISEQTAIISLYNIN